MTNVTPPVVGRWKAGNMTTCGLRGRRPGGKHDHRRHVIGCDTVMWGTDYPHPEGTWPHTVARLRSDFADVPVEDAELLLGLTAARCYGFDVDALRPLADRIGPTPADLGQDPTRRTDPAEVAAARWWKQEYRLTPPA